MIIQGPTISYDASNDMFLENIPIPYIVKYLKGIYTNKERFIQNFIKPYKKLCTMYDVAYRHANFDYLVELYDKTNAYSYDEAFKIKNNTFRAIVFGSINVPEMIKSLGHTKQSVEGKELNLRVYKEDGSYKMEKNTVIYELYSVNLTNLGVNEEAYVVKCWCTSTNKEHWLWVEKQYALKGPLEAIASTIRVYKNMIPYIKTIKRQGDVLLFEMTQEVEPEGEIIPLSADQYFSLLISQS